MRRLLTFVITTLVILSVAACARKPAATATYQPLTATIGYQTLPPTWTATSTFTPIPTKTPSLTPTPIPTLSAEVMCNNFKMLIAPDPTIEIPQDGKAPFGWKGIPENASMKLIINQRGNVAGLIAEIPIAGDGILPIPLSALPTAHDFTWRASLIYPAYGEFCVKHGVFKRKLTLEF